jgi:lipopolysaccharide transport system ATP-binding protein
MYMRLAFAVAAHFDPEILLVDEVLAVGDAAFQRKCVRKMRDVGASGASVLFVSHNMTAVTRLCQRAILLSNGTLVRDGPAAQVANEYLRSDLGTAAARDWPALTEAPGDEAVRLRAVRVRAEDGRVVSSVDRREPVWLEMEYEAMQPNQVLVPNFRLVNEEGVCVCALSDPRPEWRQRPRPLGSYTSRACIPGHFLAAGTFLIGVTISHPDAAIVHCDVRDVVAFRVLDISDVAAELPTYAGATRGSVTPVVDWRTELVDRIHENYARG